MAAAADVPEILSNVCGVISNNYLITELVDDPIKRDYGVFNAYSHDHPEMVIYFLRIYFILIV
jgi:hypothetical protein